MTDQKNHLADLMANRRKEIFKTVRGSKLTGLRGRSVGESGTQPAAGPRRGASNDNEPLTLRRVRLGPVIEDETDGPETLDAHRYSEPND